jgi:signal transduction histidine kinase
MSSGIAHEINNPLNFIKGGLIGLENCLNENTLVSQSDITPLITAMNEGVSRVAKIVSSLNHYSHQGDSYYVRSDIHNIIDNCLTIIQSQTKNRIEIRKFYTSEISEIHCNEGKLHQAFLNVITNAVHAIEHNGIITISSRINENNLDISFEDNGSGISKDDLPRVFDPFFTTKDPGKGTGLGLSITYNIIKEHNGTIEIKSEEGKGTTVIIGLKVNQS